MEGGDSLLQAIEQEVFSIPALLRGPSFVEPEVMFNSRTSILLAGELDIIIKQTAYAPCLCTKVYIEPAPRYWKSIIQSLAHKCFKSWRLTRDKV